VLSWSAWADDFAARWHEHLDCRRHHRSAARFHRTERRAQTVLEQDPYSGHVFVFRGRRGDLIKLLWWDGDGLCLFAKRLERGRFIWPQAEQGAVSLSRAQLSMLLEGIDWRRPIRTNSPSVAV
jgi:transposase